MSPLLIAGILLALLFNFVNGMNGAANSIATIVATRTLRPLRAILIASVFNFLGPFLFTTAIAHTLGEGILRPSGITPMLLLIAIISAAFLVIIATISALPISSTHALVGGLLGAGVAMEGWGIVIVPDAMILENLVAVIAVGAVLGIPLFFLIARPLHLPTHWMMLAGLLLGASVVIPFGMVSGLLPLYGLSAILVFIIVSPVLGVMVAFLFDILISYLFRHSRQTIRKRMFQPLHIGASMLQAVGHGSHDGQHAVAVITALLLADGIIPGFAVPLWVTLFSALAIGLGTLFGGWSVIERVAKKITRIRPYQGFSASISGGIVLSGVVTAGVPVSTTHLINGTIVGVGLTRGKNAIRWDVVRTILAGWIITIPISFLLSGVLARIVVYISGS